VTAEETFRIGVDVGGTFTDFLLVGDGGTRLAHKTGSTPSDPAIAVTTGLSEIAGALDRTPRAFLEQVELIVHGTTVSTNALLTRRGARSGLLCTTGFRDVLPLRDGRREEPYNNRLPVPVPLVPRYVRIGVAGRMDYEGHEVLPLDEDQVVEAAELFRREGVEAVSVCLLHSPANDAHERRAAEILRQLLPAVDVTVSSELLPQVGVFDRTSTTVLNAYVAPIITRYIESLTTRLRGAGFSGVLLLMQANGGLATPPEYARRAVLSLLSGPAAGPVAGAAVLSPLGMRDCITVDMGGTSFESSVVVDGQGLLMTDGWVDRWRLAFPMVDIHTIGAGGGSVAYVTEGGLLRVGPYSAGADPGPACYGQGGERATVTDADMVLGYVDPATFLGGRMSLDVGAAEKAIRLDVADPLGLDLLEAAAGVFDVVNVNMSAGIREVTLNRGIDPRDLPLVVAGGAGPLHAASIAAEMGIPIVVVPRESSILCASGMLLSDFRHDFVRSRRVLFDDLDPQELARMWEGMVEEGRATLLGEGIAEAALSFAPSLDLRYRRQWYELNVPLDPAALERPDLDEIAGAFHRLHELRFGYSTPGGRVELINVRLSAFGRTERPAQPELPRGATRAAEAIGERRAWSPRARGLVPTAVHDGAALGPGARLDGPAIVELTNTTIVVPDGFGLVVDSAGSFVLFAAEREEELLARLASGG
jgi:N-methylhydantoinase A